MRGTLLVGVVIGLSAVVSAAAAQTPDGAALYREYCRTCHGVAGVPPQRMLTLYAGLRALDSTFLAARTSDSLVAAMQNGVGRDMKTFKEKMTTEQMRAVAQYILDFARPASKDP